MGTYAVISSLEKKKGRLRLRFRQDIVRSVGGPAEYFCPWRRTRVCVGVSFAKSEVEPISPGGRGGLKATYRCPFRPAGISHLSLEAGWR